MEHQRRADLMLLLATSFWGISNCLTAICLRDMQPLTLNAFRFLTAFVVLGFVFRKNVFHASCETVKYSIVVGLSLVVVYTSVTYGCSHTSPHPQTRHCRKRMDSAPERSDRPAEA